MREVSCKAPRIVLEVLADEGIDARPLVVGLPVTLDELRDPARRVDWDIFATFNERLETLLGDRMTLEELGARLIRAPSFEFLRRAGRLLMSPAQLYRTANRLFAPALFSNVAVRHELHADGRLVLFGELAAGYRGSSAFFRVSHGNAAALPRLLDLPASMIVAQSVTATSGRLELALPASHTVLARAWRGWRAVRAAGSIYRGVKRQQEALEQSLASLRTSRHELRHLLESLPDGVLVHRGGRVLWANAAVVELFGHTSVVEVVGRHVLDFMPPADRGPIAARMASAAPFGVGTERREYRVLRPDGTLRSLEAGIVQNVEFEDAPARLVLLRDVTERRRLQEQLALTDRMVAMGTLAAGVAHEINNPLAYAHASLEVAARELAASAPSPRLHEAIERAREGTERVRGIVRHLKTLSRPEDEPLEAVEVHALLEATLSLATSAITPRARVVRELGVVPHARAARGRLGQVLLNVLLNAAEALPEGAPEAHEIRVRTRVDSAGAVVIEIVDTGHGIPAEVAPRVFDPFFTTKAVGSGTGLGLAISHNLVTRMGGAITFQSTVGRGTTFCIVLPAAPAPAQAVLVTPPASLRVPAPLRQRGRVLVVDDEPSLLRAVGELLRQQHDVVTAGSGRQALDVLARDVGFDAVLADLMMADVTGMDLFDAVRVAHPGLEQRFVFMTGGAFTSRGREFLEQTSNRCIEKPFDAQQLLDVLDALVRAPAPG